MIQVCPECQGKKTWLCSRCGLKQQAQNYQSSAYNSKVLEERSKTLKTITHSNASYKPTGRLLLDNSKEDYTNNDAVLTKLLENRKLKINNNDAKRADTVRNLPLNPYPKYTYTTTVDELCEHIIRWNEHPKQHYNEFIRLWQNFDPSRIAETNQRKQTLLYVACRNGITSVVKILLNIEGIEVGGAQQEVNKSTPLHGSNWGGHTDVMVMLLLCGAKPEQNDCPNGRFYPYEELNAALPPEKQHLVRKIWDVYENEGPVGLKPFCPPDWNSPVFLTHTQIEQNKIDRTRSVGSWAPAKQKIERKVLIERGLSPLSYSRTANLKIPTPPAISPIASPLNLSPVNSKNTTPRNEHSPSMETKQNHNNNNTTRSKRSHSRRNTESSRYTKVTVIPDNQTKTPVLKKSLSTKSTAPKIIKWKSDRSDSDPPPFLTPYPFSLDAANNNFTLPDTFPALPHPKVPGLNHTLL